MKEQEMKKVRVFSIGNGAIWKEQEEVKMAFSDVLKLDIDGYIREILIKEDQISGLIKKNLRDISVTRVEYPLTSEQIERFAQELRI